MADWTQILTSLVLHSSSFKKAAEEGSIRQDERRESPKPEDESDLEGHRIFVGALQEVAEPLGRELGHVLVVFEPGQALGGHQA